MPSYQTWPAHSTVSPPRQRQHPGEVGDLGSSVRIFHESSLWAIDFGHKGSGGETPESELRKMPVEDFDVSKTDDGRVLILADSYAASFVNGVWHRKVMFKPDEIREDFITVDNPVEARRLRDEAMKALKLS